MSSTATAVRLHKDTYLDSVVQLSGTRAMTQSEGVKWASAAMATAANLETLREMGVEGPELQGARANDLFLAVLAGTDEAAAAAIEAGEAALFGAPARGDSVSAGDAARPPRSLAEAQDRLDGGGNVAIVSVPGPYAAIEAHKALTAGLHVLLFSDNVPLDEEVELKDRARDLGLLVMGPGAGTAMLGGTGLGFANVVKPLSEHGEHGEPGEPGERAGPGGRGAGRVGVVAAAGTGAQEAMSLLDQWGVGVSHVIGLGGRDLSEAVGGRMAIAAIEALEADPHTDAILLVSKPPAPDVARTVTSVAGVKPLVAALIGLAGPLDEADAASRERTVTTVPTLEQGVTAALHSVGKVGPDPVAGLTQPVAAACRQLSTSAERRLIRGLFSGGTLCYEALSLLSPLVGEVYSNTPIDKRWGLPAPAGSHMCLDLGEEEYTKGRPHPMIDPEARIELMRQAGAEPCVAVILIDVVLGYGSHPDPAGLLAPVAREVMAGGDGPQVVAYVLGTEGDPQGLEDQRRKLRDAGCIVPATAARAALAAAALAIRKPDLVGALP
ncbi:MAG: FdrA protein [Acidimicrobiaceae bacterium]|nr:FdrA protein [Acidimicrobiaceae bacterium]